MTSSESSCIYYTSTDTFVGGLGVLNILHTIKQRNVKFFLHLLRSENPVAHRPMLIYLQWAHFNVKLKRRAV